MHEDVDLLLQYRGLARRPNRLDRPARHGRLVTRPRGDPADVPAGDVPRPRHDASAGDSQTSRRSSTSRARCSSSPRSPARPWRRAPTLTTSGSGAQTGELWAAITDPGSALEELALERELWCDFRRRADDRRPLLGAVGVRDRAGRADGDRPDAVSAAGTGDGRGVPAGRGQPGPRARALARRGVAGGPGQDLRRAEPGRLRPLGRAAARGVDREARQGADPRARRAGRRARPPGAGGAGHRPVRARPGVLPLGVRDRGGRLDPRHQPVRPAGRAGGEGQDERRSSPSGGEPHVEPVGSAEELFAQANARRLRLHPGVRRPDAARRGAELARARRAGAGRRRAASSRTASVRATCTRPGSCTRAARRPGSSCRSSTTPARSSRSPVSRSGSGS